MQDKIILFLQTTEHTNPHWVILNADGEVREHVVHGNPEELANLINGQEVIALVPAEDVLLVHANLPKLNRSRLIQAIPYALEEQLTDDVDALHFAAAEHQEENQLPVAIVARDKMTNWLTQLAAWRVRPDVLTSTLFAVPYEVLTWQILLFAEQALVRISPFAGFSCDRTNLTHLMKLALAEHQVAPTEIHVHNYSNQPWHQKIENIKLVENINASDSLYPDLAMYVNHAESINLLQGSFATRKSRKLQQGKLWKGITIIAVLWLAILFLYPTVSYLILKEQLDAVNQEINAIYKRNFPQATSMIAPKMRMQEKLQRLSSNMGQNRSLLLIGYLSKVMPNVKGIHLKKMDYQNNRLTLEITANSSDAVANFTEALSKLGLSVKQQNANLNGNIVNATLTVE